jgi:Mn2+/Fe2+ NRAMP family transporter
VLGRIGRSRLMIILALLGPGLISAASDNDAGGVTTWSVIGARYGYSMLWLLLLITPILAVTQEMGARMGAVTGKGLAALIREKFSLKMTAFAMIALLIANFGTTVAEFSGVAAAFSLAHIPAWLAVPPIAIGVWLLVTRGNYRKVERVFLVLTAIYVAYFIAGILAKPSWGAALHGTVVPKVQLNSLWILTAIAAIGTTITPWGQFFIQAYVVDKRIGIRDYIYTKWEVWTSSSCSPAPPPSTNTASSWRPRKTPPGRCDRWRARPHHYSSASVCSTCRSSAPASCRSRPRTRSPKPSVSRAGSTRSAAKRRRSTA